MIRYSNWNCFLVACNIRSNEEEFKNQLFEDFRKRSNLKLLDAIGNGCYKKLVPNYQNMIWWQKKWRAFYRSCIKWQTNYLARYYLKFCIAQTCIYFLFIIGSLESAMDKRARINWRRGTRTSLLKILSLCLCSQAHVKNT